MNYDDDEQALVSALQGQQFLVITLSAQAPPDTHSKIVKAAAKAGVPYIMPNVYGSDIQNKSLCAEDLYGTGCLERCAEIESLGISYIAMVCGFWYEWSVAFGDASFGFDIKNKKVTFFDDGKTPVNVSSWNQCARSLVALLSLPETGASPSVSHWKNKPFYLTSFKVSQRGILDSIHRVSGTTDKDWEITYKPSAQRYKNGIEEMQKGNRMGFVKAMYTHSFYPNGGGEFESIRGLDSKLLGIPKENLDEATKRAVDLTKAG